MQREKGKKQEGVDGYCGKGEAAYFLPSSWSTKMGWKLAVVRVMVFGAVDKTVMQNASSNARKILTKGGYPTVNLREEPEKSKLGSGRTFH